MYVRARGVCLCVCVCVLGLRRALVCQHADVDCRSVPMPVDGNRLRVPCEVRGQWWGKYRVLFSHRDVTRERGAAGAWRYAAAHRSGDQPRGGGAGPCAGGGGQRHPARGKIVEGRANDWCLCACLCFFWLPSISC